MVCEKRVGWLLDEIVYYLMIEMGREVVIEYPNLVLTHECRELTWLYRLVSWDGNEWFVTRESFDCLMILLTI